MNNTSKQLKKALAALGLPVAVALGYLSSFSQGIPPQTPCGTPPAYYHQCSSGLGGCDTHRICEEASLGLAKMEKPCCYHEDGKCVQVIGDWECCDLDPPSWKAICYEKYRDPNKVCIGDTNCQYP